MHFYALGLLPAHTEDIEEAVERLMAPYDENLKVELVKDEEYPDEGPYWTNPRSFWDWYQVGGRWTGVLSDYDPHRDPQNWEPCDLCGATGVREASGLHYETGEPWCNGCDQSKQYGCPKGWRVAWTLAKHPGDIVPVGMLRALPEWRTPYTLVTFEGAIHREERNPDWVRGNGYGDDNPYMRDVEGFEEKVRRIIDGCPSETIAVVIDYHC